MMVLFNHQKPAKKYKQLDLIHFFVGTTFALILICIDLQFIATLACNTLTVLQVFFTHCICVIL